MTTTTDNNNDLDATPDGASDLRDLGKQLPVDRPDANRRDALRSQLISAAAQPVAASPRRWLLVGAGFAAGLAAAFIAPALLGVRNTARPLVTEPRAPTPPTPRIEVYTGASRNRADEEWIPNDRTGIEQVLHLHSGRSRLVVPEDTRTYHPHVQTSDSDIEGYGEWVVVVEKNRLQSIDVTTGIATLRIVGQGERVYLAHGQSWTAPVETADLAIAPPPAGAPPTPRTPTAPETNPAGTPDVQRTNSQDVQRTNSPDVQRTNSQDVQRTNSPGVQRTNKQSVRRTTTDSGAPIETELAPSPRVSPSANPAPAEIAAGASVAPIAPVAPAPVVAAGAEIERHFRAGEALLRANKLAEAIVELGAAADAGETPLAADARYYQAVALVKARRGAEAERALVQFLDRAGATSVRRGRAAMMLGRLIADRGDRVHARAWFEVAARDGDPAVAAAAAAQLR